MWGYYSVSSFGLAFFTQHDVSDCHLYFSAWLRFLFIFAYFSCVWMYHSFILIVYTDNGHLRYFWPLATMNGASVTLLHVFWWTCVHLSIMYICRHGVARAEYTHVHFRDILPKGCSSLYFPQRCVKIADVPYPCQQLVLSVFLISAIVVGVQWLSHCNFMCISLTTNDVAQFFHMFINHLDSLFYVVSVYIFPMKSDYLSFSNWVVEVLCELYY